MSELNGLANIIGAASTLHAIEEPPVREEWNTDEEFWDAQNAYACRQMFWHGEVKPR